MASASVRRKPDGSAADEVVGVEEEGGVSEEPVG